MPLPAAFPSLRSALLLLAAVLATLAPPRAAAQTTDCRQELETAEQRYNNGSFDEAITLLEACLEKEGVSREEQRRAYRLMGLNYIAKDLVTDARSTIRLLLELVPGYEPDPIMDPPPFIAIVEEIKRQMTREEVAPSTSAADSSAVQEKVRRPGQDTTTDPSSVPLIVEQDEEPGGMRRWLFIGGAVVGGGILAAVLLGGGGSGGPGPIAAPPNLPGN